MGNMKLNVNLLTYNGEKYIPHLFNSLKKQTFKDWKLNILDNASTDNTIILIKKELENFDIQYNLELNTENIGFARGHNQLFKKNDSEYVLLLNQDLFLGADCLEKLVNFLDANKDTAGVAPRLMQWDFENQKFTNKIDSLGLEVYRSRRVIDWKLGENWGEVKEQIIQLSNNQIIEIFGISGTCPMFRKSALSEISFDNGGVFDKDYGSYKEDVDLAYRLRSAGHKLFVVLGAVGYHDRTSNYKNKKNQSKDIRYNSYKNHIMTIYKNEYWQNFILDFPWILWYEISKFIWFLFFDTASLRGLGEVWALRKQLKVKRLKIKRFRKIDWLEMRRLIKKIK